MQSMPGHILCGPAPDETVVCTGGTPAVGESVCHPLHSTGQSYGASCTIVGRVHGEVRRFGVADINSDCQL